MDNALATDEQDSTAEQVTTSRDTPESMAASNYGKLKEFDAEK